MTESVVRMLVDRVEAGIAVLLAGEDRYQISLPKRFLPPDAVEGTVLLVRIGTDKAATRALREEITRLIDELDS
jgi:hypothetical protein